jgi:hypothetical protein
MKAPAQQQLHSSTPQSRSPFFSRQATGAFFAPVQRQPFFQPGGIVQTQSTVQLGGERDQSEATQGTSSSEMGQLAVTPMQTPGTIQRAYDWWFKKTVLNAQYNNPSAVLPLFKQWLRANKNIGFNDLNFTSKQAETYLREFYDDQPPDRQAMDWSWKDSILANCYAYAVGDKTPEFDKGKATAKPGGSVGKPANPQKDADAYTAAILTGAEKDGLIKADDDAANMPDEQANHRLVAVISDSTGFHWYRRNSNGIWTWKDGNDGQVYNYTLINGQQEIMTDLVAIQVFTDPTKRFGFPNMTFKGYFYAPIGTRVGDKLDR